MPTGVIIQKISMDLEEKIFMVDSFNNLDLRKLTRIDNQNGKKAMIHREAIEKDKLDRVRDWWVAKLLLGDQGE